MAGFTGQDDLINQVSTNGKFYRSDWQKSTFATTAHTAGLWYSLQRGGGNPPADTILGTGTNLAFQQLSDSVATAGGIPHGGSVGGGTGYKHLLNAAAQTAAATTAPCVLMLVDLLSLDHWDMRTGRNGENTAPSYSQSLDHWDMRTGRNS